MEFQQQKTFLDYYETILVVREFWFVVIITNNLSLVCFSAKNETKLSLLLLRCCNTVYTQHDHFMKSIFLFCMLYRKSASYREVLWCYPVRGIWWSYCILLMVNFVDEECVRLSWVLNFFKGTGEFPILNCLWRFSFEFSYIAFDWFLWHVIFLKSTLNLFLQIWILY